MSARDTTTLVDDRPSTDRQLELAERLAKGANIVFDPQVFRALTVSQASVFINRLAPLDTTPTTAETKLQLATLAARLGETPGDFEFEWRAKREIGRLARRLREQREAANQAGLDALLAMQAKAAAPQSRRVGMRDRP